MFKKYLFPILGVLCCCVGFAWAEQDFSSLLPLLQKDTRSAGQNQQVLQLFTSSKDASTIFAAGASLVRIPPAKVQEAKLLNVIIKDNNMLKKVFSAIILTAMGTEHTELSPILQDAITSEDLALRSYAAAAYTILNPQEKQYRAEIINLYIYDAAFAQRAMNLISSTEKQTFKFLKEASKHENAQIRAAAAAWLGDQQTQSAAKQLSKMAKSELDPQTINTLAVALAKNKQWTLPDAVKGLKTPYTAQSATTYALALGFMTGHALSNIKQALSDSDLNTRINAARAAAYMAAVLSSDQAVEYSMDISFDKDLVRGLIPALSFMVKRDEPSVKVYADNALKQISKLK